jgi:pimeloyl-ACP methyl ester carboxylesterase
MFVAVNGAKLFFDTVGAQLDVVGAELRQKPALIALHGGPGLDHLVLRPFFDRFADIAQVVYVDLRGNGRSAGSSPETWTLAQWGDDVRGFCDQLGIERPIVFGNSFGGYVVQSYATRHPSHPAGIILSSTVARFDVEERNERIERAGGAEARAAAEQVWDVGGAKAYAAFDALVMPLFVTKNSEQAVWGKHVTRRFDVVGKFHRPPAGELRRMDFRSDLAKVQCPTLVLSGGPGDLIAPPEAAREMADSMPQDLVRFECLAHCRHGVFRDDPEAADRIIRSFIGDVVAQDFPGSEPS